MDGVNKSKLSGGFIHTQQSSVPTKHGARRRGVSGVTGEPDTSVKQPYLMRFAMGFIPRCLCSKGPSSLACKGASEREIGRCH